MLGLSSSSSNSTPLAKDEMMGELPSVVLAETENVWNQF